MTSPNGSPSHAASSSSAILPRLRSPERAAGARPNSDLHLNFRRSNASISALINATSGLSKRASSPIVSSPLSLDTPTEPAFAGGVQPEGASVYRDSIVRGFAPHIAVLASPDAEELLAQKGFTGGLLELLRPYGEHLPGKVTIRDSVGASKSYEDYGVRFVKLKDGLESPRPPVEEDAPEVKSRTIEGYMDHLLPHSSARIRTGGDIGYVEELVERHLYYANAPEDAAAVAEQESPGNLPVSPFHLLYLRRLLSGHPVSPHESLSHPVACLVAISSRNQDPIEELRTLYASTTSGDNRLPQWINNEYLRYYVLIHDEEHDDVQRSTQLFEQMKRHFGLHCHLLRLRSTQCVPSDDEAVRLPVCEWLSAAEELAEIQKREALDDLDVVGPCLYETDATAVRTMIRELVTQSVIPMMERQSATWNDQIVSKRRGLTGRFMSLSKKWTTFGTGSRSSSNPFSSSASSNSNYDSTQGFYRPDTPEALMRRLADYCVMLRDYKLACTVFDMLRSDYQNDKAWKHYAGACEMTAVTSLLGNVAAKGRESSLDGWLDAACYSYITRCDAPFYALRTQALAVELLHLRGAPAADEAAKWAGRILECGLVRSVGTVLFTERVAQCFMTRPGTGSQFWGGRRRKAALWSVLSAQRWLELGHRGRAAGALAQAWRLYGASPHEPDSLASEGMREHLVRLTQASAEQIVEELLAGEDEVEAEGEAGAGDGVDESIENMGSANLPMPSSPVHKRTGSSVSIKHGRSGSTLSTLTRHQRGNSTLSVPSGDADGARVPVSPGAAGPKGLSVGSMAGDGGSTEADKAKLDIRHHRTSVIGMDTGTPLKEQPEGEEQ